MAIRCCKDCPERHTSCWSDCEHYLAAKAQHEKEKAYMRQYTYCIERGSFLGDKDLNYMRKRNKKAK